MKTLKISTRHLINVAFISFKNLTLLCSYYHFFGYFVALGLSSYLKIFEGPITVTVFHTFLLHILPQSCYGCQYKYFMEKNYHIVI